MGDAHAAVTPKLEDIGMGGGSFDMHETAAIVTVCGFAPPASLALAVPDCVVVFL